MPLIIKMLVSSLRLPAASKSIAAFLKVTVNSANLRVSETAAGMQEGRDMGQGKVLQR